ncbi:MAG: TetR family transcriptional regulator [Hydrogenophaga sp.]|nr:TetR family transcriptional regulator [Hydrogenophaga sp.]
MVRRTKADAQATRQSLLDAAEVLFLARGVSGTSLNDIAVAAGTTRGAIYWHFKDKADLFNAMMERVTLPMEQAMAEAEAVQPPLQRLRTSVLAALHTTATDEQARRVFQIATQQVEFNGEMLAVRERKLMWRDAYHRQLTRQFRAAATEAGITLPAGAPQAAQGLQAILSGLLHDWLLSPDAFDLVRVGVQTVDAYLAGLGFAPPRRATRVPRAKAHKVPSSTPILAASAAALPGGKARVAMKRAMVKPIPQKHATGT